MRVICSDEAVEIRNRFVRSLISTAITIVIKSKRKMQTGAIRDIIGIA